MWESHNVFVRRLTRADLTEEMICVFCKTNQILEFKYGPLYSRDGIVTHYFCLLFASALNQHGKDNEGIMGFLPTDVLKEVRRGNRFKCFYCQKPGACIGCCNKKCRKTFHFPCGLENGANYQFFLNFETFCIDHCKQQNISLEVKNWFCPVCMTSVSHSERPIQASCCKAAVFHKDCMQKVALNAGYFFKCPTCNDSQDFTQEMRSLGIYVPLQDASWELDPNAYADLLQQYSNCDAETCECPQGRKYISEENDWLLARCQSCGASGIHLQCGKLDSSEIKSWMCTMCEKIENKVILERERINKEKALKQKSIYVNANDSEDDEDFQMSDLTISPACYSYFPYKKSDLGKYETQKSLPDWRGFEITVNLVDWMKPIFSKPMCRKITKQSDTNPGPSRESQIFSNTPIPVDDTAAEEMNRDIKIEQDYVFVTSSVPEFKRQDSLFGIGSPQPSTSFGRKSLSDATPSPKARSKFTIFPFVTNFLKSNFVRDKRKLETVSHCPAKKPLMEETDNRNQSHDESKIVPVNNFVTTAELSVPNSSPEKQMVPWKSSDPSMKETSAHKTLMLSKELTDMFSKIPSPQSFLLSYSPIKSYFPKNLPSLTFHASQSSSADPDGQNVIQAVDLSLNSSRNSQTETAAKQATGILSFTQGFVNNVDKNVDNHEDKVNGFGINE